MVRHRCDNVVYRLKPQLINLPILVIPLGNKVNIMKQSVYRQKAHCIDRLNSLDALTIQITDNVCAIDFEAYASVVNKSDTEFDITFEDADRVEVSLEDFVKYQFQYTEEALEIEAKYADRIDELRELQAECQQEVCYIFAPAHVVSNDDSITEVFGSEAEAKDFIDDDALVYYQVTPTAVEFELGDGDGSEQEPSDINVTVSALLNAKECQATFNVQTVDGYYLPQMGCWITTNKGDGEFTAHEKVLYAAFDVAEMAENWYRETHKEAVIYHDGGFNVLVSSQSVDIKEKDGKFYAVVVNNDFSAHDYNLPEVVGSHYDSLDEAMAYLNQFRGNEHEDFTGLKIAIADISSHH